MRKTPTPDPDPTRRPSETELAPDLAASAADQAATPDDAEAIGDDQTAPSLVWPPVEDELNDWEVLNLQSTGQTIIEPMKFTPPAGAAATPPADRRPFTPPPTPAPYVPPAPIDDPAGETSLLPISDDRYLPETELIEPLTALPPQPLPQPAAPPPSSTNSASRAAAGRAPAAPDDRTVVIPRPPGLWPRPTGPVPPQPQPQPSQSSHEDTNPGTGTRILVAPAFAASVGHAPTVPVSALHRTTRPQPAFGPRPPMEDTLPAGVTRDQLADDADRGDRSDDTAVHPSPHGDTHPVPIPAARRAPAGPAGPSSPFSRVPSFGGHTVGPESASEPAPISLPAPPLAFGPRVLAPAPVTTPAPVPAPFVPAPAPAGNLPVPGPSLPASAVPGPSVPARPEPTSTRTKLLSMSAAVIVLLLVALGVYQVLSMRSTAAGAPVAATLSVESSPAGAIVTVDGTPRGKTPVRLELAEGSHALDVSLGGATRHVPLRLAGGTITAHSFEFTEPVAPAVADAAIEIRSEPAGGRVLVDGVARGVTPLVVTGLTAGRHDVQVSGPFRAVTRPVTLAAKQQALLVITPARTAATETSETERPSRAAAADVGYLSIQSPIVLRVVRNGDFVGTSEDARLSLPVGNQVIGLENESVGFRDVRTVEVIRGKVTAVPVVLPKGEISINARPWAEVFVDGERVGETPVSQLTLPVGVHEIVFRHPDLGERRASVVVKIGATGRAFTDFTK